MQDLDQYGNVCKQTSLNTTSILQDKRDFLNYNVARLADENCWMSENLDLVMRVSGNIMKIFKTDSTLGDFTSTYTNFGTNKSSWTLPSHSQGYSTQTTTGLYWNIKACSYPGTGLSYTWTSSDYTSLSNCNDGYEVRSSDPNNSYGNFYNWPAATAGSGTTRLANGALAGESICPSGWHLPYATGMNETTGIDGSYSFLLFDSMHLTTCAYNSHLSKPPLNYTIAGAYNYSSRNHDWIDSYAHYWAAARATRDGEALYLHLSKSEDYNYIEDDPLGYGFTVRCVSY